MPCKQIVKTHPAIGAEDRNPADHVCANKEFKGGFCKRHHPDEIQRREMERSRNCKVDPDEIRRRRLERRLRARVWTMAPQSQRELAEVMAEAMASNARQAGIDAAIALLANNGYRVEKAGNRHPADADSVTSLLRCLAALSGVDDTGAVAEQSNCR